LKFEYPRLRQLIFIIITANKEINGSALASELKVSERTLRSDIKALNKELQKYKLEIVNVRAKGYKVIVNDNGLFEEFKQSLIDHEQSFPVNTYEERIKYLLLILINAHEPVSIDYILDSIFISYNTLNNYLSELKNTLDEYHLSLHKKGETIELVGNEIDKRACIIDKLEDKNYKEYIMQFSKSEKRLFINVDLDLLLKLVSSFFESNFKEISDYTRKNIAVHLALSISRAKSGHSIKEFSRNVLLNPDTESAFSDFFKTINDKFNIDISEPEKKYIIYHIAINDPNIILNKSQELDQEIKCSIDLFLDKIMNIYEFDFHNDDVLKKNLYQHLKSVVKINSLEQTRKNPLLDVILSTFPLAYEVTATSVDVIEDKLNLKLSRDEISFITLHVGASLERNSETSYSKKNAAIICGSGTATASLLRAKLSSFDDYLNITGIYSYAEYQTKDLSKNDFLISTVPLLGSKLPTVQIDLANYASDSMELYEFLTTTMNDEKNLNNLFQSDSIFISKKSITRKEALNFLCNKLEKSDIVNSDFKDKMFERENMYSTAIGGQIAIPHPIKASSKQSRVGLLISNDPISWDENGNKVRYVFLLAIRPEDYPKIQSLFSFLVNLQNDEKFKNMISKCKSSEEVMMVIKYSIKNSQLN